MDIQWFPGHMAKAVKLISENLKIVDVVIEILDARIPHSSKNPEIDKILKSKPKIVAFNKSDLADDKISSDWSKWYSNNGYPNVFIDSISGKGIKILISQLKDMMKDKIDKEKQKGKIYRPIRTMVIGIPNVGKSSFINKVAGKSRAATGDKPGITRQKQWVRPEKGIELLDMPGILWPKFDDPNIGLNLAFTGAIKDDIIDTVDIASKLMEKLSKIYPDHLKSRYKLDSINNQSGYMLLETAGKNRGCLVSGGNVDLNRIAAIFLDEFRGGRIGKISLEIPPNGDVCK